MWLLVERLRIYKQWDVILDMLSEGAISLASWDASPAELDRTRLPIYLGWLVRPALRMLLQ